MQLERKYQPKFSAPFATNQDPTSVSVLIVEKLSIAIVTVRLKIGQNIRKLVQKTVKPGFGMRYANTVFLSNSEETIRM